MQGWFKIHRELFESDLWHDVSTFRLFLFLLAQASHKDGVKTKGIELQRGQYVRSYRKLADDLSYKEGRGYKKYSLSTIKSCVNKLIDAERVNVKETEAGTLFTILNYAKYQDFEEVEKESPNTPNEEVRTNAELTPNEVRTNPEQEQELKNLRTKEFSTTTSTTAAMLIDSEFAEVRKSFEANLCMLSPIQDESLEAWFNDFNRDKEIIYEAIKIAADRNRKNFGMVEYLFREWASNKLSNVEQIQTYERNKFDKQRKPSRPYNRPSKVEQIPEWFKRDQQEDEHPNTPDKAEIERKRTELAKKLENLRRENA